MSTPSKKTKRTTSSAEAVDESVKKAVVETNAGIANYFVDIVGSFVRPKVLLEAREKFAEKKITQEDLTKVEDEEIKKLVEKEVAVGLKVVTDGEFRRSTFNVDFYQPFKGLAVSPPEELEGFPKDKLDAVKGLQFLHVVGKLEYNENHPEYKGFEYLKSLTPEGVTPKINIPSPTFPFVFTGKDFEKRFGAPYTDNKDLFYSDLSEVLGKTIQHFYDLGCRLIQFDEPTWFLYPSMFVTKDEEQLDYSQRYVDCVLKVLLPILKNKPADLTITFHFCRGNSVWSYPVAPAYDTPFIADAVKSLNLAGYLLEYDKPRCGTFEPLKAYSEGTVGRLFIGTVCTKTTELETEEYVEGRIKEAAKYAPIERLGLTTQCGFCTAVTLPQDTSEASQWEKLALMVKVAKKLWGSA